MHIKQFIVPINVYFPYVKTKPVVYSISFSSSSYIKKIWNNVEYKVWSGLLKTFRLSWFGLISKAKHNAISNAFYHSSDIMRLTYNVDKKYIIICQTLSDTVLTMRD